MSSRSKDQGSRAELESQAEEMEAQTEELRAANEELHTQREELQAVNEALGMSESRYRELVQNANSAIIRWKRDGTITFFNEYAQEFFGYSEAEAVGRHADFLLPEQESTGADLTGLVRDIVKYPERYVNHVNENVCRDGRRVWMAWTNRPILDENGQLTEILAIGSDITERKQAGDDLVMQNAILQGVNRTLQVALQTDTEEEFGQACLEIAESVTGSRISFIGEIGADGYLHDLAVSNPGWAACRKCDPSGHRKPSGKFPIRGIYGRVLVDGRSLIVNEPATHPDRIGLPPGHPPLECFLGAPLTRKGRTVGIVGVGNRPGGYRLQDQQALEALAPAIVEALDRRRIEAAVRQLSHFPQQNPNPVLRVAADGTLSFANRPARDWLASLGWEAGELLPAPVRELAADAYAQGHILDREVGTPDGTLFWFSAVRPASEDYVNLYGRDITERKRAEDDLRRERGLLDSIMRTTDVMLVLLDSHFNFVWVNPAYAETCRMTPQEMVGKNHFTLYPDPENEAIFRKVRDTGEGVFYKDKPFLFPDQPERGVTYWDWSLTPTEDAAGNVTGLVFSLRETTKFKQAEEALRQSEERLRLAQQAAHIGAFEWDARTGVNRWTAELEAMYGLAPGGFAGTQQAWEQLIHPQDRQEVLRRVMCGFETGEPQEAEWRVAWPDGSVHWVAGRWQVFKDESGGLSRMAGVNIDITERRRAEAALRESEERLHRLFEDDLTGNFLCTPEGEILLCNPAFARIFGFSRAADAVGTNISQLYVDPGERDALLERLKRQEKIERLEVWRKRRDGRPVYIVENVVGRFDDQGCLLEIKGYTFDDTERKRAEEALRELNATLEGKVAQRTEQLQHRAQQLQKLALELSEAEDRERRRLAEVLHDDLQQILAAAKFHLSLLRNRARHDPSQQEVAVQVDRMLRDAIEKSRSLSHELSPTVLHHGDFGETMRWLAHEIQVKHGLVVHVDTFSEVTVKSDALRTFLYKTAQELLFNVVKHARVDEARVRVRRLGRCISLSVSDHGRGFEPQELKAATGFGLFSIRERIELLGGRMRIKSARSKGSTFYIVVPDGPTGGPVVSELRFRDSNVVEAGAGQAQDKGPRLRVLVADDHQIVREGLVSLLNEQPGIEVVDEAANGREAVNLTSRLQPDVVIMDVAMPLINGDEATRQIKMHLPETRVIALSMYDEPDLIERMYQAGAEAFVLKTAPSEELLAAVRGRSAERVS